MSKGIVGGGNWIVDYVKTIDVFPTEQTLANIREEYTGTGGAPYNLLRNLAVLGCEIPMAGVGRIGDDAPGKFILDDCKQFNIDMQHVQVMPGVPTSYTLPMVVKSTGKRTFFHQRGANAYLTPDDFDFSRLDGEYFHYGYLLLLDGLDVEDEMYGTAAARVLAKAKEAGFTTSIDLVSEDSDRFRQLVPPSLKFADLIFMNEFEASRASGVELVENGELQSDRVCEVHERLHSDGMLILHWAEGAAVCEPSGHITWQGSVKMPQERITSVVGAGDAFASGFMLGHMRGETIQESLRLGVCCAASCITGPSCTDGVMSEADCSRLGAEYGFRDCPM